MVCGANRFGEQQGAVGGSDRLGELAERLVLRRTGRHDLPTRRERVEVLVGGPTVGAGVVGGEVVDGSEEVAERLVGDALDLLELSTGGDDTALGGVVFGALLPGERYRHEADAGLGAHAVGDRRGEVVAVADPTEVRQQDRLDGVIGAFERGGETEALLILGQQALAEDRTAEAVALVGDEDATAVRGREWYSAGGRVAGGDEDVAVDRAVAVAIAQASDLGIGHPPTEAFEPLFHEHPRRHDDQREQASMYGIVDRREGDVGLARPGDRLDHPAAATSVPRHQGVVLPAVEVVRQGSQATTPAPRKLAIAAASWPSSARICSVCSPTTPMNGRNSGWVAEKVPGGPA